MTPRGQTKNRRSGRIKVSASGINGCLVWRIIVVRTLTWVSNEKKFGWWVGGVFLYFDEVHFLSDTSSCYYTFK